MQPVGEEEGQKGKCGWQREHKREMTEAHDIELQKIQIYGNLIQTQI